MKNSPARDLGWQNKLSNSETGWSRAKLLNTTSINIKLFCTMIPFYDLSEDHGKVRRGEFPLPEISGDTINSQTRKLDEAEPNYSTPHPPWPASTSKSSWSQWRARQGKGWKFIFKIDLRWHNKLSDSETVASFLRIYIIRICCQHHHVGKSTNRKTVFMFNNNIKLNLTFPNHNFDPLARLVCPTKKIYFSHLNCLLCMFAHNEK